MKVGKYDNANGQIKIVSYLMNDYKCSLWTTFFFPHATILLTQKCRSLHVKIWYSRYFCFDTQRGDTQEKVSRHGSVWRCGKVVVPCASTVVKFFAGPETIVLSRYCLFTWFQRRFGTTKGMKVKVQDILYKWWLHHFYVDGMKWSGRLSLLLRSWLLKNPN